MRSYEIPQRDVVWFPPGEKQWHGASPTTTRARIAEQSASKMGQQLARVMTRPDFLNGAAPALHAHHAEYKLQTFGDRCCPATLYFFDCARSTEGSMKSYWQTCWYSKARPGGVACALTVTYSST